MFKENRDFWLYFLGIIVMFFLLFSVLRGGFQDSSLIFSGFPFNLVETQKKIFAEPDYVLDKSKNYQAIIKTNRGDIEIDLLENSAPNTVSNFIYLANNDYYDGLLFHRYLSGLLLQGGSGNTRNSDPNDDKFGGPGYVIKDEINWDSLDYSEQKKGELKALGYESVPNVASSRLKKYSLAMASNGPNTGGSQFVIILADSNDQRVMALEGKHTVFGSVIGGFTVLEGLKGIELIDADSESPRPLNFRLDSIEIKVKE